MLRSCNHAGNIAAALTAMLLVSWFSMASVFFAVLAVSILAAASVFLIRSDELDERRASGVTTNGDGESHPIGVMELFRDRRVVVLFSPRHSSILRTLRSCRSWRLYIKHLEGSDRQVAAVVLVAQTVMVPVALLTGWLCDRWGRKPIFAIGFIALPLRIFLYSLTSDPKVLVVLQALDGIGAGIYGVAVVAVCADLTRGKDDSMPSAASSPRPCRSEE